MPIHPERLYLAMRFADRLGVLEAAEEDRGCGFCTGFAPKPQWSKSANSPWYSKMSLVQIPA